MSGRAPTYSDEQRAACVRRMLDDRVPATQVAAEARAGDLAGLEPFPVTVDSCRRWRADALQTAELEEPVTGDRHQEVTARLWKVHLQLVQDLERAVANKKEATSAGLERMSRLSAATTGAMRRHAAARALIPGAQPPGDDAGEAEGERKTWLDALPEPPEPNLTKDVDPEGGDAMDLDHVAGHDHDQNHDEQSEDDDQHNGAAGRATSHGEMTSPAGGSEPDLQTNSVGGPASSH